MQRALVLFAHGSRDARWAQPFREIQRRVAARVSDSAVELAFLEIMQPALPETLERLAQAGATRVTVAPLFMAEGAHLRRDLEHLVSSARECHPGLEIVLLPAVGAAEPVLEAISAWVADHA